MSLPVKVVRHLLLMFCTTWFTSTFSNTTVMAIVMIIEAITMISWPINGMKCSFKTPPIYAPGTVIESFPKK